MGIADSYCLIHTACHSNNIECVKTLINDPFIDIDEPTINCKLTPLHIAAHKGHYEIADLLLKTNKVNINSLDFERYTPLLHALKCSQSVELIQLLISNHVCLYKNNIISVQG